MKRNIILLAVFFTATSVFAEEIDSIAVRVGEKIVLKSEILNDMRMFALDNVSYETVRAKLIERLLVLKAAQESKLVLQDWAVENRINEIIAHNFGGDRNKLMQALTERRISLAEWRARMKDDMVAAAMRWQMVDRNVEAAPAEMRREYMKNPGRYMRKHRVSVSVILLSPENAAKKDEVSAKLKESPFADVARHYSSDSHASQGGKWENVEPEAVFNQVVCEEISRMPKGTLSNWIEIDGWCFLLRKDDEFNEKALSFSEAYDSIRANVMKDKADAAYAKWIERLKQQTYIKVY